MYKDSKRIVVKIILRIFESWSPRNLGNKPYDP